MKQTKLNLFQKETKDSITIDTSNEKDFQAPNQETIKFISSFVRPGDLVFDVGANIGYKTDLLLLCQANVICIEPQRACVAELKRKYRDQLLVKIEPIALGAKDESRSMYICKQAPTISTLSQEYTIQSRFVEQGYRWEGRESVRLSTLDAMIAKYGRPVYCKIDVENYELDVLRGLTSTIGLISFEANTDQFHVSKACLEYLNKLGYQQFNYAPGERGYFLFPEWLGREEFLVKMDEVLATYDFSSIWGLWGDIYAQ